jgi:ATP-dependent Zn protease
MAVKDVQISRKRTTKLERTAYHEAGHVVAHYVLRIGFRYVTIIPSGDYLGHVKGCPYGKNFRPYIEVTLRMRDRLEKEIVIFFAGNEAEKKFVEDTTIEAVTVISIN